MDRRALATAGLTAAALVAFASNSILCRLALGARRIDALTFTNVRLVSGAVALAAIVQLLVPVLAAAAGIIVLHETLSARLVLGGTVMLAGVLLAVLRAQRR